MDKRTERFTEHARDALCQAEVWAIRLGVNYVGTEHMLLGLNEVSAGKAARVLHSLGVTTEWVRERVEAAAQPA